MENYKQHTQGEKPDATMLLAYVSGKLPENDKQLVEQWMQQADENLTELTQIARIYYAQLTKERIMSRDSLAAYEKVRKWIHGKTYKLWLGRIAVVAACMIGIVVLSYVFSLRMADVEEMRAQVVTVQSTAGMRTEFNLPDGTIIHLNSGSSLTYPIPFDRHERRVKLSGEAFFNVSHNAEQPFIVSTLNNRMSIRVLGTEFNVEAYDSDRIAYATLIAGEVQVSLLNDQGVVSNHPLSPSEKLSFDQKKGTSRVEKVDPAFDMAWMEGKVVFKDTPLPEVLRKLSHFYNVDFEVKDKIIESYLFTGTFDNRQLQQVLEYLKISSGINYSLEQSKKDDSEGLSRWRVILRK